MKKKQMMLIALAVSAIASVGVYRLVRRKMDEDEKDQDADDTREPRRKKQMRFIDYLNPRKKIVMDRGRMA